MVMNSKHHLLLLLLVSLHFRPLIVQTTESVELSKVDNEEIPFNFSGWKLIELKPSSLKDVEQLRQMQMEHHEVNS